MPSVLCPEGAVRLVDGDIEQEGRVEVCFSGVWGSICRYGWSASDAYVACKQLGYDPGIGMLKISSLKSIVNALLVQLQHNWAHSLAVEMVQWCIPM